MPLKSGAVSTGQFLRGRVNSASISVGAIEVVPPPPWLEGWLYRKSHIINAATFPEFDDGTNYSIKILVAFYDLLDAIYTIGGYEGSNPVIPCGPTGAWNEKIREIGNPIYDPDDPGKQHKIWFTAYKGTYNGYSYLKIGFAYSSDGISWTQQECTLNNMPAERALEDPYVIKLGSLFHMYAELKASGNISDGIGYLTSSDGATWTYQQKVLDKQGTGWEGFDVSSPVVWKEGNVWYMLYEGRNYATQRGTVGKCESTDGVTWTNRVQVLTPGAVGRFDDEQLVPYDMMKVGPYYYFSYSGYDGTLWRNGMARTTDFSTWVRLNDGNPVGGDWEATCMQFYKPSDRYIFYYYNLNDADVSGIYRGYPNSSDTVALKAKCKTDFGDIRFTRSDGLTLLDYWMESKVDGVSAVLWVKITDSLRDDVTLYIYYGKTDASTTSDGDATFLFFDDFLGSLIDGDKWSVTGSVSVSNSEASMTNDAAWTNYITSKTIFTKAAIAIRFKGKGSDEDHASGWQIKGDFSRSISTNQPTGSSVYQSLYTLFGDQDGVNTKFYQATSPPWYSTGIYYVFSLKMNYPNLLFDVNDSNKLTKTDWSTTFDNEPLNLGNSKGTATFDWILVRKYVYPEPAHGIWGEEESAS